MTTIVDWRDVDARALALVFARERARWLVELGWETRDSWLHIERARTTWGLPGLAAVDDGGRVRGLTFFHANGPRFDLGGVFAESPHIRQSLLDAAISVCDDAGGVEMAAFLYEGACPDATALASRGFVVEPAHYLSLTLDKVNPAPVGSEDPQVMIRDWRREDVGRVAELLHRSYDETAARRFVPDGGEAGWRDYLDRLIRHAPCGSVLPSCTRLASVAELLVGAVLVTELGPGTAHLAQVVVHPDWRRRGLGGELVDEAVQRIRAAGYGRVTLLASAVNGAAQSLYRDRGFATVATFLSATRVLGASRAARAS